MKDEWRYELSDVGLTIIGNPTFDEWLNLGGVITSDGACFFGIVGDWIRYGRKAYGTKYKRGIDYIGLKESVGMHYANICKRMPAHHRRAGLSTTHHIDLMYKDDLIDHRSYLLALADRHQISATRFGYFVLGYMNGEPVEALIAQYRGGVYYEPGYVYILEGVNLSGLYKIGMTNDPDKRISKLEVVLPFDVDLTHIIKTSSKGALEAELHNRFASRRVRGEWFALTEDDLEYLKSLKEVNYHER